MTAGRGIVHAEVPKDDGLTAVGMQLWVDLPKSLKYTTPRYRDVRAPEIPLETSEDGKVTIKVISGQTAKGTNSLQELSYTPVWLLDITMKPGSKLVQPIPSGWNAFAYSIAGTVLFGSGQQQQVVPKYHNTVFEQKGDTVVAEVDADAQEGARFIIAAGMPLDQPIVQYGPFVVTTSAEIQQAMHDYQTNSNGFEKARNWTASIDRRVTH
jgi:redox-sensitive bicupin YhaK (pirin superfamily)